MTVIRWATIDDAAGVAAVHVETWRVAYRGLIEQQVLDALRADERTARWENWITRSLAREATEGHGGVSHRLLVAERDDRIIGWATFGAGRDEGESHRGELAGLYAHPSVWSQGTGHALIRRVEEELRAEGRQNAYLWVLRGNDRAIRFYERHGWMSDGTEKVADAGGATNLPELRHARRL
ncbi:MAG TPA: GNAT family N-acetyltransferase [Microbacterium sp.]|nr:GNAT family N-acetyltransferase [Microbacterium sp.]